MSSGVELRAATLADVEVVTDYYFRAWRSNLAHLFAPGALDEIPDKLWTERSAIFARWFGGHDGHRSLVAVSGDGGAPFGHVTVVDDELLHLFIDPGRQGGGVGTALLDAGEQMIADAGYERARLMTLVGNDAAVAFYARHGWSVTGYQVSDTYFGEPQVEQELAKKL